MSDKQQEGQPRRTFLAGMMAAVGGAAALLSRPKSSEAREAAPTEPASGPVLYRRNEETERYYTSLYRS